MVVLAEVLDTLLVRMPDGGPEVIKERSRVRYGTRELGRAVVQSKYVWAWLL